MQLILVSGIRECPDQNHLCSPNGRCTVKVDSFNPPKYNYKCECKDGFSGDGVICAGTVYMRIV